LIAMPGSPRIAKFERQEGFALGRMIALMIAAGLVLVSLAPDAMAQGKKAKKSAQPACLNALACGPQPVPQIRKPKSEKFMKSAS
jgi:hypothetical protein